MLTRLVQAARLLRLHTLRGQMLAGFLSAMATILIIVGVVTFDSVADLLKQNAERHIQQTAVQGNGRLEAILGRIDSLSLQVATNEYVQQLLTDVAAGRKATFAERQALQPIADQILIYGSGVRAVEIYSNHGDRLFPLGGDDLYETVGRDLIIAAHEHRGGMFWIGVSAAHPDQVSAIRRINLIHQSFAPAGYLLVRIDRSVFRLDSLDENADAGTVSLLFDRDGQLIATTADDELSQVDFENLPANDEHTVELNGRHYVLVKKQSEITGWTLLMLTPVEAITKGISALRAAIIVSAGIGLFLFAVLSLMLSAMITRPILRLIKTMRSARFGELKPTSRISSTAEINELVHTYNQMVDNMNELIRLVYEKEIMQNRAELKALQAQIHPHFLYNTLEALYWSLLEKDEEQLADYVVALSELFRYTITGLNREEWVTLAEELEQVERYLLIMGMRFGDRLKWHIDSEPDAARILLPKLTIQPLVENAIQHGIENKIGPGSVSVSVKYARRDKSAVHITVEDDGAGMDEETLERIRAALAEGRDRTAESSSFGIANVQQRLRLYYGGDSVEDEMLVIRSGRGTGTSVTLTIPNWTEVQHHEPAYDLDRG